MANADSAMRGSRRLASASIENPNVSAPRRIRLNAMLHAPTAIAAAMPSVPYQWLSRKAAAIASTTPFNAATSGGIVSSRAKNAGDAERQFDQAVGKVEPRHRRRRRRGDDRAGHHQQLRRARCHHAGRGLAEKTADILVERNSQWRCDALATAQHQHGELQQPG